MTRTTGADMKIDLSNQWQDWADKVNWQVPNAISTPHHQLEQVHLITEYTGLKDSDKFSIVEIGPHDGTMASGLLKHCSEKIERLVLVDGSPMIEKCKDRLSGWEQVEYCLVEDSASIEGEFDLLVSCHCLAETTLEYQNYIYNKFFPVCKEVFILQTTSASFHDSGPNHENLINNINRHYKQCATFTPTSPVKSALLDHQKLTLAKK
tara:strand:+ start:1940 stop:2563 length:624 start_codon:yes stop_codon:yes gene_type:complete